MDHLKVKKHHIQEIKNKVRQIRKDVPALVSNTPANEYISKIETFNEDVENTPFDNAVGVLDVNYTTSKRDAKTSVSFRDENTELDARINLMLKKVNNIWTCTACGKTDNNNKVTNVKKHIESHIEGLEHPCGHCGKTFRSRNCLLFHLSRAHRFK